MCILHVIADRKKSMEISRKKTEDKTLLMSDEFMTRSKERERIAPLESGELHG